MKNPSLLLVATFLLLACTGQNRYAIQLDAASSDVDGYQLALYHQNADPSLGALDSALVEKGRCEINGTIDSADWYVLVLHDPQRAKTITQLVYLDGKLDVKLSGDRLQIQGSAVNDAWQGFMDESSQDWKAAITKHGLEWPQLSDLSGWKSVAANLYAVSSIPHTVLLDPEGVIVMKNLRGEGLEAALAERLR